YKIRSVVVVLPASTCAIMPMLRSLSSMDHLRGSTPAANLQKQGNKMPAETHFPAGCSGVRVEKKQPPPPLPGGGVVPKNPHSFPRGRIPHRPVPAGGGEQRVYTRRETRRVLLPLPVTARKYKRMIFRREEKSSAGVKNW